MTATRRVIMFIMSMLPEAARENWIAERGEEGGGGVRKERKGGKWRAGLFENAHTASVGGVVDFWGFEAQKERIIGHYP